MINEPSSEGVLEKFITWKFLYKIFLIVPSGYLTLKTNSSIETLIKNEDNNFI